MLERSVVLFNLLPLVLSADCARLQNKLVLFSNTVCPPECHPFRSLHGAHKIAPDADSDACSTVGFLVILMKLLPSLMFYEKNSTASKCMCVIMAFIFISLFL